MTSVWLREVDAGTNNACWVVCAKGDPEAVQFTADVAFGSSNTILLAAKEPEPTADIPLPSREALKRLLELRATGGLLNCDDVSELMEAAWWALHNLPEGVDFFNITTRHPIQRVYFRAGLLACREYIARFVGVTHPEVASSIRANWWPSLGVDPGAPRRFDFDEIAEETETGGYRSKEIDASVEALPRALGFLEGL